MPQFVKDSFPTPEVKVSAGGTKSTARIRETCNSLPSCQSALADHLDGADETSRHDYTGDPTVATNRLAEAHRKRWAVHESSPDIAARCGDGLLA